MLGRWKSLSCKTLGRFFNLAPVVLAGVLSPGFASSASAYCPDPFPNWANCDFSESWSGKPALSSVVWSKVDLSGAIFNEADLSGAHLYEANLSGADLRKVDLTGADLRKATLTKAILIAANLRAADLSNATLIGADLHYANLNEADLQGAVLTEAKLQGADLIAANLQGAHLSKAKLQGADLKGANLQGAHLSKAHLSEADLYGADLSGANLEGAILKGTNLHYANLEGANLSKTDLKGANLNKTDLKGANLGGANLTGAELVAATLNNADLTGANLNGANLSKAGLRGADLSEAKLRKAILTGANLLQTVLSKADLTGANLRWANLRWAILRRATLITADLEEADLTEANLIGADLSGANLREADLTLADLREADLTGANLGRANLTSANLSEADLTEADLTRANLGRANLKQADLRGADLRWAELIRADLRLATLNGADLEEADLRGADLRWATLNGADLEEADLEEADLSWATWVDGNTICAEGSIGECKFKLPAELTAEAPIESFASSETQYEVVSSYEVVTTHSNGSGQALEGNANVPTATGSLTITVCPPENVRDDGSCAEETPDVAGTPETASDALPDLAAGAPENTGGPDAGRDPDPDAVTDPAAPIVVVTVSPKSLREGRQRADYGTVVLKASGGTAPYQFSVSKGELPQGLNLSLVGALSGRSAIAGKFSITVAAEDANGVVGDRTYDLSIRAPGKIFVPRVVGTLTIGTPPEALDPLSTTPDNLPEGTVGVAYGPVDVFASGGKAPYEVTFYPSNLPNGLQITAIPDDTVDGPAKFQKGVRISGVPTQVSESDSSVNIFVGDDAGYKLIRPYTVKIAEALIEVDPMTMTPDALPDGIGGSEYGPIDLVLKGGTPPYIVNINKDNLHEGLTLSELLNGNTFTLGGTPAVGGTEESAIILNAVDQKGNSISRIYALQIEGPSCSVPQMTNIDGRCVCPSETVYNSDNDACIYPEFFPLELRDGYVNNYYYENFTYNGYEDESYTVRLEYDNSMPDGLEFDGSNGGNLEGTPTRAGNYSFSFSVDSRADLDSSVETSGSYWLTIHPDPVILSEDELPEATVASAYEHQLSITGGTPPYDFAFVGSAPAGLTLRRNGLLSGFPETAGTVPITARAKDVHGTLSKEITYSLTIKGALCTLPGEMASYTAGRTEACECKPTLIPFEKGNGCGPCEDGQKPFLGSCPAPVKAFVPKTVITQDNCIGGMVLNSSGNCECPAAKSKKVNGVCTALPPPPKKKAPPPAAKNKAPAAKAPAAGCRPGDVTFNSLEALHAHLRTLGNNVKGYSRSGVFCGPAGGASSQPAAPAPSAEQPQQCKVLALAFRCGVLGRDYVKSTCDCGALLPQQLRPQLQQPQQPQQPQSCETQCGTFQDTEVYEQCFNARCN